jgi:hypothetical protein
MAHFSQLQSNPAIQSGVRKTFPFINNKQQDSTGSVTHKSEIPKPTPHFGG